MKSLFFRDSVSFFSLLHYLYQNGSWTRKAAVKGKGHEEGASERDRQTDSIAKHYATVRACSNAYFHSLQCPFLLIVAPASSADTVCFFFVTSQMSFRIAYFTSLWPLRRLWCVVRRAQWPWCKPAGVAWHSSVARPSFPALSGCPCQVKPTTLFFSRHSHTHSLHTSRV